MKRQRVAWMILVLMTFNGGVALAHFPTPNRILAQTINAAGEWPYTDAEIRENVEDQLFGDTLLNSLDVEVDVRNGVATLSGTVKNWEDRRRAQTNAYQGGARLVINQLRVRP